MKNNNVPNKVPFLSCTINIFCKDMLKIVFDVLFCSFVETIRCKKKNCYQIKQYWSKYLHHKYFIRIRGSISFSRAVENSQTFFCTVSVCCRGMTRHTLVFKIFLITVLASSSSYTNSKQGKSQITIGRGYSHRTETEHMNEWRMARNCWFLNKA